MNFFRFLQFILFATVAAVGPDALRSGKANIITPGWRPNSLAKLHYCMSAHSLPLAEPELIETVFREWNAVLPANLCNQGIDLQFTGLCKGYPYETQIHLRGAQNNSNVGFTVHNFLDGYISKVETFIDISKIPSAASFYNVLLHEIGHGIGLGHPDQYPNRLDTSVMGFSLVANIAGKFQPDNKFLVVSWQDITGLRDLFKRDFPVMADRPFVYLQPNVPRYLATNGLKASKSVPTPVKLPDLHTIFGLPFSRAFLQP